MRWTGWVAIWGILLLLGPATSCGVVDVLGDPRRAHVDVLYTGPTLLDEGDTAAVSVTVMLDGEPLADPPVAVLSSDTTILGVLSGGAILVGRVDGRAILTVRYVNSLFTDPIPSTAVEVRVRRRGPP